MASPFPTISHEAVAPERHAPSAPALKNYTGWLHALEKAQWSEQVRYQSSVKDRQAASDNYNGERQLQELKPSVTSELVKDAASRGYSAVHGDLPTKNTVVVSTMLFSPGRANGSLQVGSGHPSFMLLLLAPESDHDALANVRPERLPIPSKAGPWMESATHLFVSGNELQVWIRDQRMGYSNGLRLLQALRREFSGIGLDLISMTLNGEKL